MSTIKVDNATPVGSEAEFTISKATGASTVTLVVDGALTVNTTTLLNGNVTFGDASSDTVAFNAATVSVNNSLNFDGDTFHIDSVNNRVGVGTNSPTSDLTVVNTADATIEIKSEAANSSIFKATSPAGSNRTDLISTALTGNPAVLANTTISMKDQMVGILTASPAYTLDVLGTFNTSGNATFGGDLTVTGDFTVDGTTTTLNTSTLTVDDKNIELASTSSPSDTLADGGGLTLKGSTDKTIAWTNSTDRWHFNQGMNITEGKLGIGTAADENSDLAMAKASGDLIFEMKNTATNAGTFKATVGAGNRRADLVLNALSGEPLALVDTKMTFKDQRIGIMNTSPDYTLDVTGTARFTTNVIVGDNLSLASDAAVLNFGADSEITLTHAADASLTLAGAATTTGLVVNNTATDGDPFLAFALSGTQTFTMGIDDGDNDKFKIGTTGLDTNTRMTIDSSGNVGIGVTDPDTPLEILSTATQLKLSYDGSNSATAAVGSGGDLTITPSGNDVKFATTKSIEIECSTGDLTFEMDNNASNSSNFKIVAGQANDRVEMILDGGTSLLTFKNQRLGVLDTSPDYTMDINGTLRAVGAVTFDSTLSVGTITSTGVFTVDSTTAGSIDFAGDASNITLTTDGAAEDFTISLAGATDSSLILSSTGTGADALQISTSAGGMDITVAGAATGEDLDISCNQEINVTSTSNAANAIYLRANGGTSETIKIHADQGSGAGSIELTSDAGGVDVNAAGAISLDSTAGSIDINVVDGQTVKVGLNGAVETSWEPHGTAGSELWSTINTAGTTDGSDAAGAILLSSVAGGIGLAWADDKDLWAEGGQAVITANHDVAAAIKLHADAGTSQTIVIVNDAGTAAGAVEITATAGSIDINSGDNITIDAADEIIVTTTSADGHISLVSAHTSGVAFHIDANADAASEVQIDAGILDIDVTGAATIDAASLTVTSDTMTIASANSTDPLVVIKNTTNDANGARLQFVKDKGSAGADGDDIGIIEFVSDDAGQTQTTFAKIVAEVSEADNTDEAGKLSFFVTESDGTTTTLTAGLILEGEHETDGEVDVTIAAGAASTTTVAGNLSVTTNLAPAADDGAGLGSANLNWADLYLADGGVIYFGDDQDIVLTHDHDSGLTLTQGTDANNEPVLTLLSVGGHDLGPTLHLRLDNDASEADDDVLGTIKFSGDGSGNTETVFAQMLAVSTDITDGDESGQIKFQVMAGGTAGAAALADLVTIGGEDVAGSVGCEVVINQSGIDSDFRVESDDETHMLFVDAGSNRVSIGDSVDAPAATLEVTNHASAGAYNVPLVQLNSNDTDQVALSIEAANIDGNVLNISADAVTTATVLNISADALTSGKAIKVEDDSSSTTAREVVRINQANVSAIAATAMKVQSKGGIIGIDLDKNFSSTTAATITGLNVDWDKTGASTSNNTMYGINVDMDNTTGTNGTNTMVGLNVTPTLTHASDAGTPTVKGAVLTATGGTNGTAVATGLEVTATGADTNNGIYVNCADGGTDLKLVSSADTGDYFSITTTTHGATTISTVDDDATAADLVFDIDGDITFDADSSNFKFKDGGSEFLRIKNVSSDVVIQNKVDAKDIIFKQYDGTEVMRIDDAVKVKVGGDAQLVVLPAGSLTVQDGGFGVGKNSADTNGAEIVLAKSRNATDGSHTVVVDGDVLGAIIGQGSDGDSLEAAGKIEFKVDGTPGDSDMPGAIVFSTTADGANSPSERVKIDAKGFMRFKEVASASDEPATTSGYAFIYASDKAGDSDTEMYVTDGAGNDTKISPHDENNEWEFFSSNQQTGKTICIKMEKLLKRLNDKFGEPEWYQEICDADDEE